MERGIFQWRSLKTKVALATLAIFLAGIWSLSLYASRMLREDMERQLGQQQFATVAMVAAQIDNELKTRFDALRTVAETTAGIMRDDPASLQTFMGQRAALQALFNGGIAVHDVKGTVIAEYPASEGRLGKNFMGATFVASALLEGKPSIGEPVIGMMRHNPLFGMAVPIKDGAGKIIGALGGAIDLNRPNFLDQVTSSRYGRSGGYMVVAPQHRLIVTATNKAMVMQRSIARGIIPTIDRFNDGLDGTEVFVDPDKVEILASSKTIPTAGWRIAAVLPTVEAFAPIEDMQRRMLIATVLLSVLAGALTWWLLRHQLSPLLDTADRLADMADESRPLHPLPIVRNDEIGRVIAGFNRLLTTLEQRETLLQNILDTSSVAIFLVDNDGRITRANRRMAEMFGRPIESLLGEDYVSLIHPSERETGRRKTIALLNSDVDWVAHDRLYWRANHDQFWGHITGRRIYDTDGKQLGLVGVLADIDVRKRAESQLERMAHYDVLTGLPNRVLLADRLHQAMAHASRQKRLLAVVYLDLDGFKAINDYHGHEAGDQLLMALSLRMKASLRDSDTLARLGGDEFVAVLLDLAEASDSVSMIDRLLAAASQPVTVGEHVLQVSGSLGVTFYPQAEAVDADQLLRQADQAMYQAKLAGKNRYHIFDTEQDRTVRGHHESLQRIQEALAAREFVLYFQPKVNMRSGALIGAEALIRWLHPENGLLPPAAFLPAVENHTVSVDIGEWVIDEALASRERWRGLGLDIPVSVNVSARQLQMPDFVARLRGILARHPSLHPGDLELEILETSALEDLPGVSRVIAECRDLGVAFALDDFGTGYSSLTYLKRLPVATLKIDQSFVRDMLDDPDDLAILEGVVGLASAFRRDAVAEGVETIEHGRLLLQLGCQIAQGYGIARPMPAAELPGWAASWRPDAAWQDVKPIDRADFPRLVAGAEHRAWVVALEKYLAGEIEEQPQLDARRCRFGLWLDNEGEERYGANPRFRVVQALHRQVHRVAEALGREHETGRATDATKRIEEIHALRDALLAGLHSLMAE